MAAVTICSDLILMAFLKALSPNTHWGLEFETKILKGGGDHNSFHNRGIE